MSAFPVDILEMLVWESSVVCAFISTVSNMHWDLELVMQRTCWSKIYTFNVIHYWSPKGNSLLASLLWGGQTAGSVTATGPSHPPNSPRAGRNPVSCSVTLYQGESFLTWGFEPWSCDLKQPLYGLCHHTTAVVQRNEKTGSECTICYKLVCVS